MLIGSKKAVVKFKWYIICMSCLKFLSMEVYLSMSVLTTETNYIKLLIYAIVGLDYNTINNIGDV